MRLVLASLLIASFALAQPVREAEVTPDPPGDRKQVYTVRFAPGETITYDYLEFTCRLAQPVPLPGPDGRPVIKQHVLPHPHVHRERNVKMVKDLDCYVSFWVPRGVEELRDRFGISVVKTNAAAVLTDLKLTAVQGGRPTWKLDLPTNGVVRPPAAPAAAAGSGKP